MCKAKRMLLGVLIPLLFSASLPAALSAAEKDFQVGLLLCLTGECSAWGTASLHGLQMAAAELNRGGGILEHMVVLKPQDTVEAASGTAGVTAFRQLYAQGVRWFIGPTWSAAGSALGPIMGRMPDVLATSPSLGVAAFNEAGDNLFNVWPHDEIATRALARYAFDHGFRSAAVLASQQPWEQQQGNVFADEFPKPGGRIAVKVMPSPEIVDLKPEALRIKAAAPDVVFLCNTNRLALGAAELRRIGYQGPFVGALLERNMLVNAHGALEGAVTAHYPEASKEFVDKYIAAYGEAPNISADTAYDTLMLYAAAIKQAQSFDPAVVKKTLLKLRYRGVSGEIIFDDKGGVVRAPVFVKAQGTEFVPAS